MYRYIAVNHTNRPIRTRTYGGVGGKARKSLPIPIFHYQGINRLQQLRVDINIIMSIGKEQKESEFLD
jgi:hypothetical protein